MLFLIAYPINMKESKRMDLQNTLETHVMQLKNKPRSRSNVVLVVQEITATLDEHCFPGTEELRPGQYSRYPESDIICIAWLLDIIGKDSELAGYKKVKAELSDLFPHLPERSRFNRRRRNLLVCLY